MLSTIALLTALASGTAQLSDTVHVDGARGSRVWIEGGSNVHTWACKAVSFEADVEVARADSVTAPIAELIRTVRVRLSARELKCGNRKMEQDLYSALKATDPAVPSYILGIFKAEPGTLANGTVDTRGTLQVAGVERPVATRIETERLADGRVRAVGSVPLLMTDFGVKPPIGLFGLIRAKNEVVVKFDLMIEPRR